MHVSVAQLVPKRKEGRRKKEAKKGGRKKGGRVGRREEQRAHVCVYTHTHVHVCARSAPGKIHGTLVTELLLGIRSEWLRNRVFF